MRTKYLIATQMASFVILLLSLNEIIENNASTLIFATSFSIFLYCCFYINKHKKELLREIRNEYRESGQA